MVDKKYDELKSTYKQYESRYLDSMNEFSDFKK